MSIPELNEESIKKADEILSIFRNRIKDIIDNEVDMVMTSIYCDVLPYIESDVFENFRMQIINGIIYDTPNKIYDYNYRKIRDKIFEEHKDELIPALNQDLLDKVKELEKQIQYWKSYGQTNY